MFEIVFFLTPVFACHLLSWVRFIIKETLSVVGWTWSWSLASTRFGKEQKVLALRVAWVCDSSECPRTRGFQSESRSQLFDLSLVLLENKIPLDSEKKYMSFKEQQGGGWSGLREGEITGDKVREVKWGDHENLEGHCENLAVSSEWGGENWLWAEVGCDLIEKDHSGRFVGDYGLKMGARMLSQYRWEMMASSARRIVVMVAGSG